MKSPNEGNPISAEDAQLLREIIWAGDEAGLVEEISMIYCACKGALYDIRTSGRCSGANVASLSRQKSEALRGLYAIGVGTDYIEAVNNGTYLNK